MVIDGGGKYLQEGKEVVGLSVGAIVDKEASVGLGRTQDTEYGVCRLWHRQHIEWNWKMPFLNGVRTAATPEIEHVLFFLFFSSSNMELQDIPAVLNVFNINLQSITQEPSNTR